MTLLTLPSSITLSFQPVHHVFTHANAMLFGKANVTNSTVGITSNRPAEPVTYSYSQYFANTLPSFRAAAIGALGAYLAEMTVNLPENVARGIFGAVNIASVVQKAYSIVKKCPTFPEASNAEKAKMIFTEALPILVQVAATLVVAGPASAVVGGAARAVGFMIVPAMFDWFLSHFSPNATDTRDLPVTTSWQVANKFTAYTLGYVIIPVPASVPLILVTPFKKAVSEFFFRSLQTLNQMRNKCTVDDHTKITVPALSFTCGNFAYEIANLFSLILAYTNTNDLIFTCNNWSAPAGKFAPVLNNTAAGLANILNGTIAPCLYGAMSNVFHLEPESTTYTQQGTATFGYQDGNRIIIRSNFDYDVPQEKEIENAVAAIVGPEATTRPTLITVKPQAEPEGIYYIQMEQA